MNLQKLISTREGQCRLISIQLEKFNYELSLSEKTALLEIMEEKAEIIKNHNKKIVNLADIEDLETELVESDEYSIDLRLKLRKLKEDITKSSDTGSSCLVRDSQDINCSDKPISGENVFNSSSSSTSCMSLNKTERNYCVTEQELLAIVYFLQYFRQYLLGRRFIVLIDYKALTWLFSFKEPSGKIARWIEILGPFNFSIKYRPGKQQGHCDALSRCENPRDCSCSDVDMSEPLKCGPCPKCRMMLAKPLAMEVNIPGNEEDSAANVRKVNQGASTSAEDYNGNTANPTKLDRSHRGDNWLSLQLPEKVGVMQRQDPIIALLDMFLYSLTTFQIWSSLYPTNWQNNALQESSMK